MCDLDALSYWAINVGLDFNISKGRSISFYRIREPIVFNYTLYNFLIVNSDHAVYDLGIKRDRELTINGFIETSEAQKTLDFIIRVFAGFKLLVPLKALYYVL